MKIEKDKSNILSRLFKLLYHIVLVFVCFIVFFLLYYIISSQIHADDENYKPKFSIYTIVSPSMTPVINVYDIVVNIRPESPQDIKIGDIITYKSNAANTEGMTITHRVIEISQLPDGTYEYMTQGDNNDAPDSLYVLYDDVIGKKVLIIPYLGRLQFLIANQKGWIILLLIPVSIYLIRELIKLIDLLGLRKRVDKVIGTTEESIIERRKIAKEKEQERKEQLKEELYSKEIEKESKIRSIYENNGFLEEYNETTIIINENKYQKNKKNKKEIKSEISADDKVNIPTQALADESKVKKNEKKKEEPLILPKVSRQQEIINEQYEILDTDELTSKIKEYDSKIAKLDKMMKDIEKIDSNQEEQPIEEVDNYLEGQRIKVIKEEPTKKKKDISKEKDKKVKESKVEEPINLEFTGIIPISNSRQKINRPKSVDIKELKEEKEKKNVSSSNKKQNKLNLKPNEIKKVNRPNKKKTSKKDKLNLNPTNIKKIKRTTNSSKNKQKKDDKKKTTPKQRLIVIEKIK